MRLLCFILICILSAAALAGTQPQLPPGHGLQHVGEGTVVDVRGGDVVVLDDGQTVRLAAIQAPVQMGGGNNLRPWPHASRSAAYLRTLVMGRVVQIYAGSAAHDRWGRVRAHLVRTDGVWVQGDLVARGMARVYSAADNRMMVRDLLALERHARDTSAGIWALRFFAVRQADALQEAINSYQLVQGRVFDVAVLRGRAYINFDLDWRSDFTILVQPNVLKMLTESGLSIESLKGALVRVRGWVKRWNGPMIELSHPEQLEVLKDAGDNDDANKVD